MQLIALIVLCVPAVVRCQFTVNCRAVHASNTRNDVPAAAARRGSESYGACCLLTPLPPLPSAFCSQPRRVALWNALCSVFLADLQASGPKVAAQIRPITPTRTAILQPLPSSVAASSTARPSTSAALPIITVVVHARRMAPLRLTAASAAVAHPPLALDARCAAPAHAWDTVKHGITCTCHLHQLSKQHDMVLGEWACWTWALQRSHARRGRQAIAAAWRVATPIRAKTRFVQHSPLSRTCLLALCTMRTFLCTVMAGPTEPVSASCAAG
jgi:hypothetical protein